MRTIQKRARWTAVVVAGGLGIMLCGAVWASPSGLNNIPTVDVAPRNVLVLQTWGHFESGASPAYVAGLKYGVPGGIEIGLDSRVDSGDSGPLTGQAKWRLPLPGDEPPYALLVGVANVSDDRDEAGEADPYLVSGYDFGFARLSVGYSFQKDNGALFAGIDKAFSLQSRGLVLRADVRQIDDGDEWLASGGLLHELPMNLVFEGWVSTSTADGADETCTVKLNYVIAF